jgi:HEAT repeat protein
MPTAHEARYAAEPRSSEELTACFLREGWESDAGIHAIATLHYRGGQTEFDLGRRYAASADAAERAASADILGQLGWGQKHFQDESVLLLIQLLGDSHPEVLRSAAVALGHRNDPRAIPALLALRKHPDAGVRYGVVAGLSCHDDSAAIAGLIELSRDPDDGTRDWATFGLGKQTSLDTPELRDALAARLADSDPEIRGEAMIGLALRKDDRARPAIEAALRGPFHGDWPLEAVEHLASRAWIPLIERHRQNADPEDAAHFASSFDSALAACRRSSPDSE